MGMILRLTVFCLLICLLTDLSKAESTRPLLFLESEPSRFFRTDSKSQETLFSSSDVNNAISVLLGFPPSATNPSVSSKLNGLLAPNPFYRPRNVLVLEARGLDQEMLNTLDLQKLGLAAGNTPSLVTASSHLDVVLPDEAMIQSLDNPLNTECDVDCVMEKFNDLGSWLGGPLSSENKPLSKKISMPLPEGACLTLDLSRPADQIFAKELIAFQQNIRRIVADHKQSLEGSLDLPILLTGSFNGIKVLKNAHGTDDVTIQGTKLLLSVVAKLLQVQSVFDGQFVGVLLANEDGGSSSTELFNVNFLPESPRLLTEMQTSSKNATAEIALVRKAIAWSTAVILLIATLWGVYFLFNMPLTRDSLLYSNFKMD
eukprot:TRINITY_DN33390_c0_g1_i1.p1 TRINITY_DN33390_c0_g1~~TRINITY_DN33390_c0_g1_i1.p1  ORF type:complete len:372 (+),score=60.54 TRINITY_DN33390_c0_g1_i1:174-1289(+)